MHSAGQTAPPTRGTQGRFIGVEPEPGFEQIAEELAALLVREHELRRRSEAAAEALAVMVAHLTADLETSYEVCAELSVMMARERPAP